MKVLFRTELVVFGLFIAKIQEGKMIFRPEIGLISGYFLIDFMKCESCDLHLALF